jgi:hypothetical protein
MFQALRGLAFQTSTLVLSMTTVAAWGAEPNYDEAAVRSFTLPNVLAGPDGTPAATADDWRRRSRPHQLELLETSVYGRRLQAVPVSVVGDVDRSPATLADGMQAIRI